MFARNLATATSFCKRKWSLCTVSLSRPIRDYTTKELKKFYKNASISKTEGGYEVNLDKYKLKTLMGQLFKVPNETLALGVAAEWNAQDTVIKRHTMLLTSLCNTAIDNPSERPRETVVNSILEMLDTDTICYRVSEPEELAKLQQKEWDPLLTWLHQRYGVRLDVTTGLGVPSIPSETKDVFKQHLNSYNDWALVGYQQAVECIKSFIIATALVDHLVTVEKAVDLARLEVEYQVGLWGNVEWHHEVDKLDVLSRLAASVIFVHLNCNELRTIFNKNAIKKPI